ncbi:MAG: VanZ family protein [Ilumatobacteraceae bacterium]
MIALSLDPLREYWPLIVLGTAGAVLASVVVSPDRRVTRALLAAIVAVIVGVTMVPSGELATFDAAFSSRAWRSAASWPTVGWDTLVRPDLEKILNLIMFVPLGIAAMMHIRRLRPSLIIAVGLSALIESLQAVTTVRTGDFSDFAYNSLGAAVGVLLVAIVTQSRRTRIASSSPASSLNEADITESG